MDLQNSDNFNQNPIYKIGRYNKILQLKYVFLSKKIKYNKVSKTDNIDKKMQYYAQLKLS